MFNEHEASEVPKNKPSPPGFVPLELNWNKVALRRTDELEALTATRQPN